MANQRTELEGHGHPAATLLKSPIGFNRPETLRGLGLRRIRHTVEVKDTVPGRAALIHKGASPWSTL